MKKSLISLMTLVLFLSLACIVLSMGAIERARADAEPIRQLDVGQFMWKKKDGQVCISEEQPSGAVLPVKCFGADHGNT